MRFLLLLMVLISAASWAEVEIIPLRNRTVDQVIPILRPLVEPGGALSGTQGQLIIRASLANIADLKRVLASIDMPQRRLLISLRQDMEGGDSNRAAGVNATVSAGNVTLGTERSVNERSVNERPVNERAGNDRAGNERVLGTRETGINVRLADGSTRREERVDQQVQALEGSPAFISIGQAQPLATRNVTRAPNGAVIVTDSVSYRDISTGFEVVPRIAGERVFLDINPRRETPGPGGTVNVQRMSTSASGRLGEWFEIGAIAMNSSSQSGGILSSSNSQRQENRRVWVKVEELK
ncbi:MAG: hypothetical protein ACKVQK_16520 [Burkholderiales bacterium]